MSRFIYVFVNNVFKLSFTQICLCLTGWSNRLRLIIRTRTTPTKMSRLMVLGITHTVTYACNISTGNSYIESGSDSNSQSSAKRARHGIELTLLSECYMVATASSGGTVKLWSVGDSNRCFRTLEACDFVISIGFSSCSKNVSGHISSNTHLHKNMEQKYDGDMLVSRINVLPRL